MPNDQFEEPQEELENSIAEEHSGAREALSDLYESAIEAERETGIHETSIEKAKRSLILRILSIIAGTFITILGIIMLVAPGPGLLTIVAGLGILAVDVPFARRLLEIARKRVPQNEEGKITQKALLTMVISAIIGIALSAISIWYSLT